MHTKHAFVSLFATGGLLCALLLSACGNAASSTAATATTAVMPTSSTGAALSHDFTSTDGVINLKYPDAWTMQALNVADSPNAAMFSSANSNDIFVLEPLNVQVTADNYSALGTAFLQGIKATDVQMGTTSQSAAIGASTWTIAQGTATFNGTPSTLTELGTDHNGTTLLIFTLGPTATDNNDGNTYFQPMVTSLMFMK